MLHYLKLFNISKTKVWKQAALTRGNHLNQYGEGECEKECEWDFKSMAEWDNLSV